MKDLSSFMIAAPHSGSGKTTVTLGLLRALSSRGYQVQPFKCGPDYIDTKYHDLSSGKESINLDLFLSSEKHVSDLYARYASSADVCITEGVMGLYDGYDKQKGSSAEIAKLLQIPVVLVVNAKSAAYSVAPLLYGFKHFDSGIRVIGVIFNFVASESHYAFLKQACDDVGIRSFGYLPKNADIEIPSRHLGLSLGKDYLFDAFADKAAAVLEQHIHLDELLKATLVTVDSAAPETPTNHFPISPLRIAVARDDAFNFVYHENIACLRKRGEVVFFSPLSDHALPEADLVYFPGGYPELYLKQLSENTAMHECIRNYAEQGGRIFAECGGMMYLSSSITDNAGLVYPMVGLFSQKASMQSMKLKLGYRQFHYQGKPVRGHEFHYSHIEGEGPSLVQQYNAKGMPVDTKWLRYKHVIGGYTHVYWAEKDNLLDLFN